MGDREEINLDDVESMAHFGVIRDWVITLKDGREIMLGADIIKNIVEHENKELGYRKPKLLTPAEIEAEIRNPYGKCMRKSPCEVCAFNEGVQVGAQAQLDKGGG